MLGGEDFIYSQQSGVSEELFKGSVLGVDADVASVDFRQNEIRSLSVRPRGFWQSVRYVYCVLPTEQTERANRTMLDILRAFCNAHQINWDKKLSFAEFSSQSV